MLKIKIIGYKSPTYLQNDNNELKKKAELNGFCYLSTLIHRS